MSLSPRGRFWGAFLHLIPEAAVQDAGTPTFMAVLAGFALFVLLEQFVAWHRGRALTPPEKARVTHLILLGNGLHNVIGVIAIHD